MDHRHAVVRRRLGRVRAGEHASLSEQHPVRRSWRAARSADRRCHRALRVVPGADRHGGGRSGAGAGARRILRREQEADGSWFGRWGTNYIYGTWSVLCALNAAGIAPDDPAVRRAVAWLLAVQRDDGGWGEDEETYRDAPHGRYKESTPSQTAWALLGLMAAGEVDHPAVARGIAYLTATQARRWRVARAAVQRRRFSARVLSALPRLSLVFPAAGAGALSQSAARQHAQGGVWVLMRAPSPRPTPTRGGGVGRCALGWLSGWRRRRGSRDRLDGGWRSAAGAPRVRRRRRRRLIDAGQRRAGQLRSGRRA